MESNKEYYKEVFKGLTLDKKTISNSLFEECEFVDCSFEETTFSETKFNLCKFTDCKLNNSKLTNVSFNEGITFDACKCLGLGWQDVYDSLGINITAKDTDFSYNTFSEKDFQGSTFEKCVFKEADFTGSNLKDVNFIGIDLSSAIFNSTDLTGADLSTSFNYFFDLSKNKTKGLLVNKEEGIYLLKAFGIKIK